MAKVPTEPDANGCLIWQGYIDPKRGYGQFRIAKGNLVKAHRFAFMLANGYDAKHNVCHTCDVRSCVNPAHLWEGTQSENLKDCVEKGRGFRGELSGTAKLTAEQVQWAREAVAQGHTQTAVAAWLGVAQTTISKIVHGQRWSHLKGKNGTGD